MQDCVEAECVKEKGMDEAQAEKKKGWRERERERQRRVVCVLKEGDERQGGWRTKVREGRGGRNEEKEEGEAVLRQTAGKES